MVQWCTYVHGQREAYFLSILDLTLCYSNQNTPRSLKNVMDHANNSWQNWNIYQRVIGVDKTLNDTYFLTMKWTAKWCHTFFFSLGRIIWWMSYLFWERYSFRCLGNVQANSDPNKIKIAFGLARNNSKIVLITLFQKLES